MCLVMAIFAMALTLRAQTDRKIQALDSYIKPTAKSHKGMFNIYEQDNKYLVEIPDHLLNRDILTSITIIRGSAQRKRNPADRFGFAGDAVGDRVIRFRKGQGANIELFDPTFVQAFDTLNIYLNVLKNTLLPALVSFDILAKSSNSSLIDITAMFNSDSELFSLKVAKEDLKLGSFDAQKSKVLGVNSFDNNIVFRSVRSYTVGQAPTPSGFQPPALTVKKEELAPTIWEVGASWYLLPERAMKPRYADARVGYFTTGIMNYDKNPEQVEMQSMANRWRIEPKSVDLERYLRGEIVEPEKPIVFYIDRDMPKYLIPYVIQGVNAWQSAFEKIGFKNAIVGKLAPTLSENPEYSMEDARYSYISYKPSEMANAYGPQVVDPRSGEIITSHIAVFHSILEMLQRWYFSMCAVNDPKARKANFDQDLIGKMLKNVITHEVGHTLGLRHNFIGSSTYALDSIRRADFVRKNSFGPSVMDYMRFNYVVQPGDGIPSDQLLPRIGVYDDYAIEWGYKYRPNYNDSFKEAVDLSAWVTGKRKDPRFNYINETDFFDPRVQSEDVGDNSMKASRLGVANLKLTMSNLEKWVKGDDDNYLALRSFYRAVEGRYYNYLVHVVKNVGGAEIANALRSESKFNYTPLSREQQKEAMAYLSEYMLTEPKWMYPESIKAKTGFDFDTDVERSYSDLMGRLLSKYSQIVRNQQVSSLNAYTVKEFLTDLRMAIYGRIKKGEAISQYDRMLQRNFVNKILGHAGNKNNLAADVSLEMKRCIDAIEQQARKDVELQQDSLSKMHLTAIADMIKVWRTGKRSSLLNE